MDFTTNKILLGASGGAAPETYYYTYINNFYNSEGISGPPAVDDDGNVFLGWKSKSTYPYHIYDAHDIVQLDEEGNKVDLIKHYMTPSSGAAGRGVAVKSNGQVVSSVRGGGRYGIASINFATPSVVSSAYPGGAYSGVYIEPSKVYTYGSNDVYLLGRWTNQGSTQKGPNIVKLNSSNQLQWSGFLYTSYGHNHKSDQGNNGDIAICTQYNPSGTILALAKINTSGSFVTGSYINYVNGSNLSEVALDDNGDMYVLTMATESVWYNGILAKFNGSTGALIWMKEIRKYNTSINTNSRIAAGDDGVLHLITLTSVNGSSVEYMYYRINSSGTKIYERKISHTIQGYTGYNPTLIAKNKCIYITMDNAGSQSSHHNLIIKLPDSGDITGTYNQLSVTNVGTFYTVQSLGSNYSTTPLGASSAYTFGDFTSQTTMYSTFHNSHNAQDNNVVDLTGPNVTNYTLPL